MLSVKIYRNLRRNFCYGIYFNKFHAICKGKLRLTNYDLRVPLTTGTRIPDPPFSSFGPSLDYGMNLCLEVYL